MPAKRPYPELRFRVKYGTEPSVRRPAVAGAFYPDIPQELSGMISVMLDDVHDDPPMPKAIIAPHAGYIYSGSIAASAYAPLEKIKDKIKRIILLGPAHRYPLQGIAYSTALEFATPLGNVPVDWDALKIAKRFNFVTHSEEAFEGEHSLEVHLPFLQTIFTDFKVLPLVVGHENKLKTKKLIEALWGGEETLIVVSSDLSHYHSYEDACELDEKTAKNIVDLNADGIGYGDACGRMPVNGLLEAAKAKGLKCHMLDLRNSGDTAGDRNRVVGYGAFYFVDE